MKLGPYTIKQKIATGICILIILTILSRTCYTLYNLHRDYYENDALQLGGYTLTTYNRDYQLDGFLKSMPILAAIFIIQACINKVIPYKSPTIIIIGLFLGYKLHSFPALIVLVGFTTASQILTKMIVLVKRPTENNLAYFKLYMWIIQLTGFVWITFHSGSINQTIYSTRHHLETLFKGTQFSAHSVYSITVSYNFFLLKQIAFGIDYYTAIAKDESLSPYSLWKYYAYMFYAPLYIAGPIESFSHFAKQMYSKKPKNPLNMHHLKLFIELIIVFGCLMTLHRYFKVQSLLGCIRVYLDNFTVEQMITISYATLLFMYFKFKLIWSFFQLAASIDGVRTIDNMPYNIHSSLTLGGFWRCWHRSFNVWLSKYLYIPLGGNRKRQFLNVSIVFIFVAFWHDIDPRLFYWGIFLIVFFVPEIWLDRLVRRHFHVPLDYKIHLKKANAPSPILPYSEAKPTMHPPSLAFSKLLCIRVLYATCANLLLGTANLIGFQLSSRMMDIWEMIVSSAKGLFAISMLSLHLACISFVVMAYYHAYLLRKKEKTHAKG